MIDKHIFVAILPLKNFNDYNSFAGMLLFNLFLTLGALALSQLLILVAVILVIKMRF